MEYLLHRPTIELGISPVTGLINSDIVAATFDGGIVNNAFYEQVFGTGYPAEASLGYLHDLYFSGRASQIVPALPQHFFKGVTQAVQCFCDNPSLREEALYEGREFHAPFIDRKGIAFWIARAYKEDGLFKLQFVPWESEEVLCQDLVHVFVLPVKKLSK